MRNKPTKWSKWIYTTSDHEDQRFHKHVHYRIIGYIDDTDYTLQISPQDVPLPVYEVEQCVHWIIKYPEEQRKPRIYSKRTTRYYRSTKYPQLYFCFGCFELCNEEVCYICPITKQNLCKVGYFNKEELQPYTRCYESGTFPSALHEELIAKACHPDRPKLFESIMAIDELKDLAFFEI